MKQWLRRADPGFYRDEPRVLLAKAQVPRYSLEAQAEARLNVMAADRTLYFATALVALGAFTIAICAGALDPRTNWLTISAFAVLAVVAPNALPSLSQMRPHGAASARKLAGVSLVAVAVALLVSEHLHPIPSAVLLGALTAGACVFGVQAIGRISSLHPQIVTYLAFTALLVVCAYTFAFNAAAAALRVPAEIVALAVAYLGICIMAGRIRRAEFVARPNGGLSIPQSIVPLLERSHDHAVICWLI